MKYFRAVVSIILLVALDQYTKYMVMTHLELHTYHPILGNVFGLYYLQNQGMAWGMFQQKQIFFLIFTVIVLIVAGYIYVKLLKDAFFRPLNICILFLVSGAIGNMIDRMFNGEFLHGGVVDFLYIKCINFPVFNVADMYVTLSIFVIILLLIFKYRNTEFEDILGGTRKKNTENEADGKNTLDSPETLNTSNTMNTSNILNSSNVSKDGTSSFSAEQNTLDDEELIEKTTPINLDEIFLNEEEEDE